MSSESAFCDCGYNKHQGDVCTLHVTKNKYRVHPFYTIACLICFPSGKKDAASNV